MRGCVCMCGGVGVGVGGCMCVYACFNLSGLIFRLLHPPDYIRWITAARGLGPGGRG
jgi:hypothetical protein